MFIYYIIYTLNNAFILAVDVYKNSGDISFSYFWLMPSNILITLPNMILKYLPFILMIFFTLESNYNNGLRIFFSNMLKKIILVILISYSTGFIYCFFKMKIFGFDKLELIFYKSYFTAILAFFLYIVLFGLWMYFMNFLLKYKVLTFIIMFSGELLIRKIIRKMVYYKVVRFYPSVLLREIILFSYNPHNVENWSYGYKFFPYANGSYVMNIKSKISGLNSTFVIKTLVLYFAICIMIVIFIKWRRDGVQNK